MGVRAWLLLQGKWRRSSMEASRTLVKNQAPVKWWDRATNLIQIDRQMWLNMEILETLAEPRTRQLPKSLKVCILKVRISKIIKMHFS